MKPDRVDILGGRGNCWTGSFVFLYFIHARFSLLVAASLSSPCYLFASSSESSVGLPSNRNHSSRFSSHPSLMCQCQGRISAIELTERARETRREPIIPPAPRPCFQCFVAPFGTVLRPVLTAERI